MSSNIIDYIRVKQNSDRADINKILSELQDLNAQDPEDAALQERIALWASRRKRTSTLIFAGVVDVLEEFTRDRRTEEVTMELPTTCQSYPYTDSVTGTLSFPAGVESGGTKFGGRCDFGAGLNYISIPNIVGSNLDLNKSTAFSIAGFIKRSANSHAEHLISKSNNDSTTSNGYKVYIDTGGLLTFGLSDGSTELTIASTSTVDDDVWHSFVCTKGATANRSAMKVYIDGTLETTGSSATLSSDITNTRSVFIGNSDDDTEDFEGTGSWFMLALTEFDSTWVTAHNAGHFDFNAGGLEILIPFVGDGEVFGEATTNYCVSS